jgi:hypothetical protein
MDLTGGTELTGGRPLFELTATDKAFDVGIGVPGALGPVGAHQQADLTSGGCPLRQGGAGAEFDVIGVRGYGQSA